MIKLVLTGSRSEFERFKNKLWEKDRDISDLRYIESFDSVRGLRYADCKLLRVGNWTNHYDHYQIVQHAYNNGMLARPRTGRRPMFQSGGMISSRDGYRYESMISPESLRGMSVDSITVDEYAHSNGGLTGNHNVTIPSGYTWDVLRDRERDYIAELTQQRERESAFVRAARDETARMNERISLWNPEPMSTNDNSWMRDEEEDS